MARLHLELTKNFYTSQKGEMAGDPSRGAHFALLTAGFRACRGLTRGIEIAPCLGAEVARLPRERLADFNPFVA